MYNLMRFVDMLIHDSSKFLAKLSFFLFCFF
uniref:Uncharacterized protein n=1 Tax=Rhizophora mucronata TaxID=61149 RepID=A0A2P2PFT9_RHIMU